MARVYLCAHTCATAAAMCLYPPRYTSVHPTTLCSLAITTLRGGPYTPSCALVAPSLPTWGLTANVPAGWVAGRTLALQDEG